MLDQLEVIIRGMPLNGPLKIEIGVDKITRQLLENIIYLLALKVKDNKKENNV